MIRLYDNFGTDWACGNAYKIRLLLGYLNQPFERINIPLGQTRSPAFLQKNPNGRIPVVEWPDGRRLSESNAILFCLGQGTAFVPQDSWGMAKTLQWQNFEQYSHEPYIAVLRWWHRAGLVEENKMLLEGKISGSYHALGVMENHLVRSAYFGGDTASIADISLFAFTCVAPEGGISLDGFPGIQAWLERMTQLPGHVGILDKGGTLAPWTNG